MTGEPRRITTNKFCCGLSRLARSTADLVSKNGRFWAVLGCFQDNRPKSSERSPLRQARVSDEGPLFCHGDSAIKGWQMGVQ